VMISAAGLVHPPTIRRVARAVTAKRVFIVAGIGRSPEGLCQQKR
jgi:hypothetical protein